MKQLNNESGEMNTTQEDALMIEEFLNENYRFRRNILSGKPEFINISINHEKETDSAETQWKTLDTIAMNSIVRKAKIEGIAKYPRVNIEEYIYSDIVDEFNPIADFLHNLPEWDGKDHVGEMLDRIPGMTDDRKNYLRIWLRSAVAHWLQMDTLHGNECVPTFIGAQGCGKSTFVQRLLPPALRMYYLDHLNLSNKFDKEMALTNNLLVNLDELDAIRPSQQAHLKQTLSKSKVNGRVIYGNTQQDRPRFASFVATTNNPHPLNDVTGSRRYICITIPQGSYINNEGEIDYAQFFAQILHEVSVQKLRYWFNNEEVRMIQEQNLGFMSKMEISDMINVCFRKPASDSEKISPMSSENILDVLSQEFPLLPRDRTTKINLGLAMKNLGFKHKTSNKGMLYFAVPTAA